MNVNKDDEGGDYIRKRRPLRIQFSVNRITTPPTEDEKHRNDMIKDVMDMAPKSPIGSKDPNTCRFRLI